MPSLNEKIAWNNVSCPENSELFQLKMCRLVDFSWVYIFVQNKAQSLHMDLLKENRN